MAKTTGFGKLERRMMSNDRLPPDVRRAIAEFKNDLKARMDLKTHDKLTVFENREGGLPAAAAGQTYYEHQVGRAREGDEWERGKRRLVALVDAGWTVRRMYFTDQHYTQGEWRQLQHP